MIDDAKKSIFKRLKEMNEKYTWIFAGTYSIAFFSILILLHFYPEGGSETLQGRLIDGEFIILNWAFGSSASSRMKDALLAEKKEDEKK